MTATYSAIATTTTTSNATTVTFSGISGSYTDLIAVIDGTHSNGTTDIRIRFNSDTGSNYSYTVLEGSGSSAASSRASNQGFIFLAFNLVGFGNSQSNQICHIMNYSNTTTYKTVLGRVNVATNSGGYPGVSAGVGLWRSTSAITSIEFYFADGYFINGSTLTLYGIKAE